MNAIIVALDEKVFVERHAAIRTGIELHHPTAHAVGIKLFVPRRIKRISEIDSLAVAADLDHLRTTCERSIGLLRMRRTIHDSTNAHGTSLLGVQRIGNIILQELSRSET